MKENLPEFLSVWISLNKPINWYNVSPFNFITPKLKRIKGNESKNLPPNAKTIAKIIEKIKIEILTIFESLFVDELAINFSNK